MMQIEMSQKWFILHRNIFRTKKLAVICAWNVLMVECVFTAMFLFGKGDAIAHVRMVGYIIASSFVVCFLLSLPNSETDGLFMHTELLMTGSIWCAVTVILFAIYLFGQVGVLPGITATRLRICLADLTCVAFSCATTAYPMFKTVRKHTNLDLDSHMRVCIQSKVRAGCA